VHDEAPVFHRGNLVYVQQGPEDSVEVIRVLRRVGDHLAADIVHVREGSIVELGLADLVRVAPGWVSLVVGVVDHDARVLLEAG